MPTNELTTYEDRSRIQRNEAIHEGASRIRDLQTKIDDAKDEISNGLITAVNSMRAQGLELLRMADREQLPFSFFTSMAGELPFDFETAKHRISIAKKLTKPVRTVEEAREVYRSALEQMNLLHLETGEASRGIAHDPFSMALNSFVLIKQKFLKALMVTPIEQCAPDRLKTIVVETQWAKDLNEQARAALGNP
jgi:hypothetical protein